MWKIQITISTLWKIAQCNFLYCGHYQRFSSFNCLTDEVLLTKLSTLHIMFFLFNFLCTLWNMNYFTFVFCGKFYINLSAQWKVYILISTVWKIQIALTTFWKISQGTFHIVETISVYSTKLSLLFNCDNPN